MRRAYNMPNQSLVLPFELRVASRAVSRRVKAYVAYAKLRSFSCRGS